MKCELCQSAEAEEAVVRKAEGKEQELYVCSACAAETRAVKQKKKKPKENAAPIEAVLPELVNMLIDATLEIMNLPSQAAVEPACPHCGITRAEYRKSSRLGCPVCYEAFAKELGGVIADMHRSPQHVGKKPRQEAGQ